MRISMIGSGNVATHLSAALKNAGHRIVQVYSRDMQHASLLAYHVGAAPVDDLKQLSPETDLLVIAVKDDAILPVAKVLAAFNILTVHTSGSTPLEELSAVIPQAGVFYPLQTLSKDKEVDFRNVPLCIEGATEDITAELARLGQTISNKVYRVSSGQRQVLHLAAVFACNFPNYLYGVARQLLAKQEMSFEMLRPLILETAQKVQDHLPGEVQTGPAVRQDKHTMQAQVEMLDDETLKTLYKLISQGIITNQNAEH